MTRTTRAAVTRTPATICRAWSRFKRSMFASLSERPREALSDEDDPEGEARHQVEVPYPVRRLGTEFGDGHGPLLAHRLAGGRLVVPGGRAGARRGGRRGGARPRGGGPRGGPPPPRLAAGAGRRAAAGGDVGLGAADREAATGEALRVGGAELLVLLDELERAGGGVDRGAVVAGLGDRREQPHLREAGVGHRLVDL